MPLSVRVLRRRHVAIAAIALVILGFLLIGPIGRAVVAGRLRSTAAHRDLTASWRRLDVGWLGSARVEGLVLRRASGDTAVTVRSARIGLEPGSLLVLRPRIGSL